MPSKISYKKLLEGIQGVIDRGDYQEFLKMYKKIRNNYSFYNKLLVYSQNPRATFVKGFCDWNKLGRGIKKGPKTIYIYAPIGVKKKDAIEGQQKLDGSEIKEKRDGRTIEVIDGIKFKRIAVYDISDTYLKKGTKKIPFIEDRIDADTTNDLYNKLLKISPVPVKLELIPGGAKGYYCKTKKVIVIDNELSQDDRTAVLIHELCHCLYDDFVYSKEREKSEIFVESVAFLVADYFNFDTSLCSFGYITKWAKNDLNSFLKLSKKIQDTTEDFIKLINNSDFTQEKIIA